MNVKAVMIVSSCLAVLTVPPCRLSRKWTFSGQWAPILDDDRDESVGGPETTYPDFKSRIQELLPGR